MDGAFILKEVRKMAQFKGVTISEDESDSRFIDLAVWFDAGSVCVIETAYLKNTDSHKQIAQQLESLAHRIRNIEPTPPSLEVFKSPNVVSLNRKKI